MPATLIYHHQRTFFHAFSYKTTHGNDARNVSYTTTIEQFVFRDAEHAFEWGCCCFFSVIISLFYVYFKMNILCKYISSSSSYLSEKGDVVSRVSIGKFVCVCVFVRKCMEIYFLKCNCVLHVKYDRRVTYHQGNSHKLSSFWKNTI